MIYLVIAAVAFAVGLKFGYSMGKADGFLIARMAQRHEIMYGHDWHSFQKVIQTAKRSAERN